ncbi:O-antigen ligase family protein [Diplocloster hominis]|uniref:O-antigen ligase family protein n=1 Tax=Diplocloster hominis TaxID=3079010 RepID=UPI0031BB0233
MSSRLRSRLVIHIRKTDVFFLIGWFLFFAPPIFYRISGMVTSMLRYGGCAYIILLLLLNRKRSIYKIKPLFMKCFFVFFMWATAMVVIKSPGQITTFFYEQLMPVIGVMLLINSSVNDRHTNKLNGLVSLYWLSVIYIVANFLTIVLYPNGIFRSNVGSSVERANWLLGSKNNQSTYLILAVLIILLFMKKKIMSRFMQEILIIIGALSICSTGENGVEFMGGSSSGMIAIAFLLVISIFMLLEKNIPFTNLKFRWIYLIIIAVYLLVITGSTMPTIQTFVENVLHKSMTYNSRTLIWQQALLYIARKPFTGYGEIQIWLSVRLSSWLNGTTNIYNLILKQLFDFGIIGLILFSVSFMTLPKFDDRKYHIVIIGIIAFFILGLMNEIDWNYLAFFPFLIAKVFCSQNNEPVKC